MMETLFHRRKCETIVSQTSTTGASTVHSEVWKDQSLLLMFAVISRMFAPVSEEVEESAVSTLRMA